MPEMCFFSCITRFLFFVYGTLGPAWHTYKTLNSGDEEFLAWAKYWIVYAFLVTIEVLADIFFSWLPLYMPTKFLLVLWIVLAAPSANVWIFDAILRPILAKRQEQIDHFLHRGKDKLLSDAISSMTQLLSSSQAVVLPFMTHLWSRSRSSLPDPVRSNDLVYATGGGGGVVMASDDTDSASASVRTSAQNLSSGSSPADSLMYVNHNSEEIQVGVSKATTQLRADHSVKDLAKKHILSLESSGILNRRVQRKPKIFKASNDESAIGISSETKLTSQKEDLHDDVEDLLAKSRIEANGQEVRQQRQLGNRRRI
ncbi:receptor expression-enhancing protein 1 [Drosophila biarmipes]|uniref:receptor expression-enhancing protein 1 n=1 Tax=Drosophila biarmipes TaxID=125945 RepID=UPI0007E8ACCA|nr:receptor expression-enhancing protein 1 [Drosophila biarmipes]